MRFEKTIDALDHACLFHHKLSNFYKISRNKNKTDKVKILLDYMLENEKKLAQSIKDYKDQLPLKILNVWFQYTNDLDILKLSDLDSKNLLENIDDIVRLSMKYSDALIELYKGMSDNSHTDELKEVFDNLADMQSQEKHKFSINVDRLLDI